MSLNQPLPDNTAEQNSATPSPKQRRPLIWRIAKWTGIVLLVMALLAGALIGTAVWVLTPERLTPLVERYASKYVDAEVTTSHVELTLWRTFPRLTLEIDSLLVRSHTLDSLPPGTRAELPPGADRLLHVARFGGSINIPRLLQGVIELGDIEIHRPEVCLVEVDSLVANYLIFPTDSTEKEEAEMLLPEIVFNRFAITGGAPVRYISLADSTDLSVTLLTTDLSGAQAPSYTVTVDGRGMGRLGQMLNVRGLQFGANGRVMWDPARPERIRLIDFTLNAGSTALTTNADIAFTESLRIDSFSIEGAHMSLADILSLAGQVLPEPHPDIITDVTTDLTVDIRGKLLRPYTVTDSTMPDLRLEIDIPRGYLNYGRMHLTAITARMQADIPGNNLDSARLVIDRLEVAGRSMRFNFTGTADACGSLTNPLVDGHFDGRLDIGRLPQKLLDKLPYELTGVLSGTTDFRFRPDALARIDIHSTDINGRLTLSDFAMTMRDSSMRAMTPHTELLFNSNTTLTDSAGRKAANLTTVSLTIDSANVWSNGVRFTGAGLKGSVGTRLLGNLQDTTSVRPLGIRVSGRHLALRSDSDSTRMLFSDINASATLTRFEGSATRPRLNVSIGAGRLMYADRFNRTFLRQTDVELKLHPRKQPRLTAEGVAVYDSLSRIYPNISLDSVYALTRAELRERRRERLAARASRTDTSLRHRQPMPKHSADIDFGVDNSIKNWLRLWDASGSIRARRGVAFTPYYPVRNMVENVNISFNTDSLTIDSLIYRSGETSVVVNGAISNIASSVTSRRGTPIKINFDLDFDTLNINTFAAAAFAGSTFASRADTLKVSISDADDERLLEQEVHQAAEGEQLAFIVPSNVEANLNVRAREVLYADIWLQRLEGKVGVANSSIHLDRLGAFTDMGTIDITALYSAPDLQNVNFAAGMVVRRLDLKKFMHMMPQIDSLLPLLEHIEGIITADLGLTTELDSLMNIKFNTLRAAVKLEGDSLVVLDNATFRKASKWLAFKKKDRNMIDHMSVELMVRDSRVDFLPFQFDIDRYKLGVWGGNTLDMSYDYHIAVLKSPLPFKFGLGIKGHGDDFRIRLGKANFNPDEIVREQHLTDTVRVNLVNEIRNMFRFGVNSGRRNRKLTLTPQGTSYQSAEFNVADTLTHADSVLFMQEGVLEMTPQVADSLNRAQKELEKWERKHNKQKKQKKGRKTDNGDSASLLRSPALKEEDTTQPRPTI